ncbi:PIN domain-containing protein [Geoglobus acetivorans]|uniref:PIN domain-containing protein n=1 Tax=Geoglobus acetivorans TaxID=565033 RepID=A0ABZ3H074_GEOAI|nr:PIN domain-containing protein [Geoglobus acetivorans]
MGDLKAITGKKSYELKNNPELIVEKEDELEELFMLFEIFEELEINREIRNLAYRFVKKYGLLPNDALILATCRFYGIKYLISFDSDFERACKKEGIVLIDNI